jgi:hypothetical protein
MISIPVLTFFLVVVAVYLAGCFAYHIRDVQDERAQKKDHTPRSGSRRHGSHLIRP